MENPCLTDNVVNMVLQLIHWADRYADLKREVERLETINKELRNEIRCIASSKIKKS